jgi:hypothetical protein
LILSPNARTLEPHALPLEVLHAVRDVRADMLVLVEHQERLDGEGRERVHGDAERAAPF